jgi:hypothetical protein
MKLPLNEKNETIVFDKKYKPFKAKLWADLGQGQQVFRLEGYDGKDEGYAVWDEKKKGWSKKIKNLKKVA